MSLTAQQEKFAQGVANGMTQADAYREAYPKSREWKDETVWREASRLAGNPKVSTRVQELREAIAKAALVETVQVVKELACIVFSDVRKLFRDDGSVKRPHELDDATAAAVASIEFDPEGGFKVKLWDKNSAADKLMKHLGGYERDNKQTTDPLTELLKALPQKSALQVVTDA